MSNELLKKIFERTGIISKEELIAKSNQSSIMINNLFSFRIIDNVMTVEVNEIELVEYLSNLRFINSERIYNHLRSRINEILLLANELSINTVLVLSSITSKYSVIFKEFGFNTKVLNDEQLDSFVGNKTANEKELYRYTATYNREVVKQENKAYQLK